jgi:hypothetical protein
MENVIKLFQELSKGFMVIPFFRMLFYGIIFSIVVTFIVGWMVGVFAVTNIFPYVSENSHSPWIPIMFGSFSFLFAFAGYLSNLQLKEDILSPIRQKLVGIWEVRARTWRLDRSAIVQEEVVTHCTIGIEDVGRKLILHFEITNSDVFADQSLDITNVMIAFASEPKKLIYFQDHELTLKQAIGIGANQIATARFPFLGVLNLHYRNDEVNEMSGLWYDIDNSVLNLARRIPDLKGMDELVRELEKGSITFKGPLSFRRIDRPAGGR